MKPRITLITLGVDDLERSVRFYRDGLGWKTEGIVGTEFEYGAVAFFGLQSGLKLALWYQEMARNLAHIMKAHPESKLVAVVGAGHEDDIIALVKKYLNAIDVVRR